MRPSAIYHHKYVNTPILLVLDAIIQSCAKRLVYLWGSFVRQSFLLVVS